MLETFFRVFFPEKHWKLEDEKEARLLKMRQEQEQEEREEREEQNRIYKQKMIEKERMIQLELNREKERIKKQESIKILEKSIEDVSLKMDKLKALAMSHVNSNESEVARIKYNTLVKKHNDMVNEINSI